MPPSIVWIRLSPQKPLPLCSPMTQGDGSFPVFLLWLYLLTDQPKGEYAFLIKPASRQHISFIQEVPLSEASDPSLPLLGHTNNWLRQMKAGHSDWPTGQEGP